ncbi:hypothetical protein [Rufibacter tibetensis]|nr:hypothetical protein [Rufibacter tibetensis]
MGNTACFVHSDGKIFEVTSINALTNEVKEYEMPLKAEHKVKGLGYDAKN